MPNTRAQSSQPPKMPVSQFVPLAERERTQPVYNCSPVDALTRFFRKYAEFSGRASRSEYWWMQLWLILLTIAISLFSIVAGVVVAAPIVNAVLSAVAALALLVPRLALISRRLHDSNHRGWWMLLWIIPRVLGAPLIAFAAVSFCVVLLLRFPDLRGSFSFQPDGSILFQRPTNPTVNNTWWEALGMTRHDAQVFGIILLAFLVIGLLLEICACVFWLIFMLLPGKIAGIRFDDPKLPMNQTVTFEAYEAWKNRAKPATPMTPQSTPTAPTSTPQTPSNLSPTAQNAPDEHPSPDQHK